MDTEHIIDQLGDHYARRGYSTAWEHEGPKLRDTLTAFTAQYGHLYRIQKALSLGGSGIALLVEFIPLGDEIQVIKLPRPVLDQEQVLNRILAKETEKLRTLRHQNIVRITFQGEIEGDSQTAFYAMEYLAGAQDADDYIMNNVDLKKITASVVEITRGALAGVAYLHENELVHLDLKPANIFVDTSGKVVVADLGFAKSFANSGNTTTIGGTDGYMHPDYARLMVRNSDRNRNQGGPIRRDQLRPLWDLYGLGKTILRLLEVADERDPHSVNDYERQYIRSMAYRMLAEHVPYERLPYGLPRQIYLETAYSDVRDAITDLGKLDGSQDLSANVPETSRYQKHMIQASSHGPVPFTKRVQRIIDSNEVRRLGQLRQLGLVSFIYPTATHSRLEHSLGTFAMVCRYVRSLYYDPFNPIFRQLVTDRDIEALLIAAITHDIGHYPLAHDLEESDESVFGHERRTLELLRRPSSMVSSAINLPSGQSTNERWSATVNDVTSILDRNESGTINQILRSCLDGPIDADKLDYLLRDSENLRLPYGRGIDVEKLIQSLTVVADTRLGRTIARVGIHERGKIAAESLAFARYAMYGSVYWHHAHRSAKAMLNAITFEALAKSGRTGSQDKSIQQSLRIALYKYLDARNNPQAELSLIDQAKSFGGSVFLDPGSEEMISWLDQAGGGRAHHLAESLVRRDLFKRALVVSRVHDGSFDWHLIEDIYGRLGKNWRLRRNVNSIVQQFVVDRLQATAKQPNSTISPTSLTRAIAATADGPAILVDYPPDKTGVTNGSSLDYLREGILQREGDVSSGVEDLEQSPVWRSLRNDSRKSLAKLRVFCHPELQGPIAASISRSDFERAVTDAIVEAQHHPQ